jgi:hypothetical protein
MSVAADVLLERWRRVPAVDPVALREDIDGLFRDGLFSRIFTRS